MATDDAFAAALRSAYERLAPAGGERFPVESDWEPGSGRLGTDILPQDQMITGRVPRVPTVPSKNEYTWNRTPAPDPAEAWAAWVERAAIREFDGGLTRVAAEAITAVELGPCPPAPPAAGPAWEPAQADIAHATHSHDQPG